MARPHHEQQDPASGTHGQKDLLTDMVMDMDTDEHHNRGTPPTRRRRRSSASNTRNTQAAAAAPNPLRRALQALPPPIFALLFAVAAVAIYFVSSRQNLNPNSVHSTSPDLSSIPTYTSIPQVSPDSKHKSTMATTEQT